ncbi:MAG TPA: YjcZ family sporulation protein [Bacillus sp. (in: firmicutes)]
MCFGSCFGYGGQGYSAPTGVGGIGSNFALIVVLFVLLIIIVCSCTSTY